MEATFIYPTHSPFVNNLHKINNDFLAGNYEYWLSMDDDNPPRHGVNPFDLIFHDLDLVGCPTPVWHNAVPGDYPIYWNAYDYVEEAKAYKPHQAFDGLQEVDAIGTGCFIVSRRVMEALRGQQPFMRKWNQDGTVDTGNDISFCQKVKKANFTIHAHYDYPCFHFNEVELGEIQLAFQNLK